MLFVRSLWKKVNAFVFEKKLGFLKHLHILFLFLSREKTGKLNGVQTNSTSVQIVNDTTSNTLSCDFLS